LLQFRQTPKVLLSSQAVRPMCDPQHSPFPRLKKMMLPDIFGYHSGCRQHTEFKKNLFPDFYRHIFNLCLAPFWAKKTHLQSSNTDLRGFAAVETSFCCSKYDQNLLESSFPNMFLKILYIVCSLNDNGKRLSTQFLENDDIFSCLAAMSQSRG
jgi:hypothetical protein